MEEKNYRDISNYKEEYDEKIRQEIEIRKHRREQLQKHRVKITRCNLLIACELVTLVVLIIALILIMTV